QGLEGNERSGQVIATVYAERMLSGFGEITGRPDWIEREEAWRQGMGTFTTCMDRAVAAGMPRDVVPSKRGQVLAGVLLALEAPDVVDTFRKEVSQTAAELGQHRSWFQALGPAEALSPIALFLLASAAAAARRQKVTDSLQGLT